MLGLQVNTYAVVGDYDDARNHRVLASKMDIMDIVDTLSPQMVAPIAVREEGIPDLEQDSDGEEGPASPRETPAAEEEAAPNPSAGLFILGVDEVEAHVVNNAPFAKPDPRPSPFGTPTSRVGLPSMARPPREAEPEPEQAVPMEPATEGGCTTSSGGEEYQLPLPPMHGEDMLQLLLRLKVAQYRENMRRRNKKPHNEYPKGTGLELSDKDEGEVRLHESFFALPTKEDKSKREPMTVTKLDEKMEKRMKDEIDMRLKEANELHAMKMAAIQAEMEQTRLEAAHKHADLMAQNQAFLAQSQQFMSMMASLQTMPQVAYAPPVPAFLMAPTQMIAPPSSSHAVYIA